MIEHSTGEKSWGEHQMIFKKEHIVDYFGVALIILSSIPFIITLKVPYLHTDEYGYWGSAAYFAGYDWANITSTNGYFSYGYGFLLALLFKITNNSILRFKLALVINLFCIIVMYFVLNKIMDNIYEEKINKILKKIICLVASMYCSVVCYLGITIPECLLTCLFAINVLLIITYLKDGALRYELFLIFLSTYLYILHQRTIIILMLNCVIMLGKNILSSKERKNKLFHCLIICVGVICLFYGCECIKKIVQENVWLINRNASTSVEVANDYSGIAIKIKYFFSREGISSFLFNCLGRVYNMVVGTWGLVIPIIICLIKIIINKDKRTEIWILSVYIFIIFMLSISVSSLFMIGSTTSTYLLYGRYTDYILPVMILFIPFVFLERNYRQCFSSVLIIIGIALCLNIKFSSEGFDLASNVSVSQVATSVFYGKAGFNIFLGALITCGLLVINILISQFNIRWLYGIWLGFFMLCNIQRGYEAFEQFYNENVMEEIMQVVDVAERLDEYDISNINVIVKEDSNIGVIGKKDKYGKIVQFINCDIKIKLLQQMSEVKEQQYYICRNNKELQDVEIIYRNENFLLFKY